MKFNRILFVVGALLAPIVIALQLFAQAPASPAAPAAAPQAAAPAAAPWPKDDAGLKALATTLLKDWFAKIASQDAAAIDSCMQPCMQNVAADGATDHDLALARTVSRATKAPEITEVIATRSGDALITTCLVSAQQVIEGETVANPEVPRIGVWQFVDGSDGSWKLAAWSSLNMPATRPATSEPKFAGDPTLNAEGEAMLGKFLRAQHTKDMKVFEAMLADGMQVVNFKGQKARADIIQGANRAKTQPPVLAAVRATRCGDLTVVSCNLSMGQSIGFTTLPADPVPFMAVFQGTGDAAKVIAISNTNKPN